MSTVISKTITPIVLDAPLEARHSVRSQLPKALAEWRSPKGDPYGIKIWKPLEPILKERGLTLWRDAGGGAHVCPDGQFRVSPGFTYVTSTRGLEGPIHTVNASRELPCKNPLVRYVRAQDGHDYSIRLVKINDEGQSHLDILGRLSTPPLSMFCDNHMLPLLAELYFEDVAFALFPTVGATVDDAFDLQYRRSSVGDLIDMLMQALEALHFIHFQGIAHRDAFHDNFLLDWLPESLSTMTIPTSRPRVYLIDFEMAVAFPAGQAADQCICEGVPVGGSCSNPDKYSRPVPPELAERGAINAYHLDVWQLAFMFSTLKTSIAELDQYLRTLCNHTTAEGALNDLKMLIASTPPKAFVVPPVLDKALSQKHYVVSM